MTQQELGTKLKQARESVGMSQADAADALNLTRTAIAQMENGKRAVSTLELSQLATLYHRPVSAFFGASDAEEDVLAVLHRAIPDFGARSTVKKQVSRYLNWCREGHNLERILGRGRRSVLPTYTPPAPKDSWQAVQQGEAIARQERKRLDLGRAPVPDMARLMRTQGIWASVADFPDSISGLFLSHTSIGMAIFANAAHSRSRKRFAYAHQYAHALMEREAPVTLSQTANASSDLAEQRASAFATAFLLPADGIAALLESFGKGKQRIAHYDVAMLARHFGVGYLAATYRLKNLHHISPAECATLAEKADMGRAYLRQLDYVSDLESTEDESITQRALRGDIIYLALEAHRREEISRGKLGDIAQLLDVDKNWLTAQAIESRGGAF